MDDVPSEICDIIAQHAGFHGLIGAWIANSAWRRAFEAARARYAKSLAARPRRTAGPRTFAPARSGDEYLSLAPPAPDAGQGQSRTVCRPNDEKGLLAFFSPHHRVCSLRTTFEDSKGLVVFVDKGKGEVLVCKYPASARGPLWAFVADEPPERLERLARYEAVGVFAGVTCLTYDDPRAPPEPRFGGALLVHLPSAGPSFRYVLVGDSCAAFDAPEPIERFFANASAAVGPRPYPVGLSATYVFFFRHYADVVAFAPRASFPREVHLAEDAGEGVWELARPPGLPLETQLLPVTRR